MREHANARGAMAGQNTLSSEARALLGHLAVPAFQRHQRDGESNTVTSALTMPLDIFISAIDECQERGRGDAALLNSLETAAGMVRAEFAVPLRELFDCSFKSKYNAREALDKLSALPACFIMMPCTPQQGSHLYVVYEKTSDVASFAASMRRLCPLQQQVGVFPRERLELLKSIAANVGEKNRLVHAILFGLSGKEAQRQGGGENSTPERLNTSSSWTQCAAAAPAAGGPGGGPLVPAPLVHDPRTTRRRRSPCSPDRPQRYW